MTLYLSSITLAELLYGIGVLPSGARKEGLSQALQAILTLFTGRILPLDQDAARRYAELAVAARAAGRPLSTADGYIAAIAGTHGFAVATRNSRHFRDTNVTLIDPWTAPEAGDDAE